MAIALKYYKMGYLNYFWHQTKINSHPPARKILNYNMQCAKSASNAIKKPNDSFHGIAGVANKSIESYLEIEIRE